MKALFRSPFVSALVGGATVAAVFLGLGITGRRTTTEIIGQSPVAATPASDSDRDSLTPHGIYVRDAPGVVFVRAQVLKTVYNDPFDLAPQQQSSVSTGSGFLIEHGGRKWILTNYHLIEGAQSVTIQFEDSITRRAAVVGEDPDDDLALLSADLSGVTARPLQLGESSTVQVGDPTLAIGNPFGLDRTLTSGIVSALQRQIQAPDHFSIDNVIQTDAPLNPGNSGGPLLDAEGRVIGINSQIETGSGGSAVGIGFAVPVDTAKQYLPQLEHGGQVKIAYLGVNGERLTGTRAGVLVLAADMGGPAAGAGLRQGDVIQALDGHVVSTMDQVAAIVRAHEPGERLRVRVKGGGHVRDVVVQLTNRPAVAPSP